MLITKYKDDLNCPNCQAMILFDGEATYTIPIGFGSHPQEKDFYVDKIQYKGWYSDCMKCKKRVLAYQTKKVISKKLKL